MHRYTNNYMKWISLFFVLILSTTGKAEGFVYHHYKLHPTNASNAPLSIDALSSATYYNQERLDELRLELTNNRKEIKELKDKIAELEKALERFKTYYFRRM